MRKQILLGLIVAALLCSSASALNTNIKSTYASSETMIIKVGGNIAETIEPDQVSFKRNNIFIPLEYDVARVGESWYIWAIAPEQKGNYTFYMNDIAVVNNGQMKKENYQTIFEVNNNFTGYNVKPGFIVTDKAFSITANVMDDTQRDIDAGFSGEKTVTIEPGSNRIDFSITKIKNTGLYMLQVGKYSIPAYITIAGSVPLEEGTIVNETSTNSTSTNSTNSTSTATNQTTQTNSTSNSTGSVSALHYDLAVEPIYIQRLLYSDAKSSTYSFTLTNTGNKTQKNVKITYNKSLFEVEPDDNIDLDANESYTFNVTLGKYSGEEIKEKILVNGTNASLEIPVFVRYTQNVTEVATFYGDTQGNKSVNATRKTTALCSELGGVVCSTGRVCKGEGLDSKDGTCCLGVCAQPASSGGNAWIGWLIAIGVLGVAWYLYFRYKKAGTGSSESSISGLDITPEIKP